MAGGRSIIIHVDKGSEFHYFDQKRNIKVKLWPFGPNGWERYAFEWSKSERHPDYRGLRSKQDIADYALSVVLHKSGLSQEALLIEVRDLVPDTRAAYPGQNAGARAVADPAPDAGNAGNAPPVELQGLDDDTALIRLSADTCLWLLVVLSILGAKSDFPYNDVIFGSKRVTANKEMWLRSIFFVGNQIPFFWVEKLMESLSYLKNLRDEIGTRWNPSELLQRTLFEFVIGSQVPETDVIPCLRSIILGSLSKQGDTFNPLPGIFEDVWTHRMVREFKAVVDLPPRVVDDGMSLELAMTSVVKWEQIHCGLDTEHQRECTEFFDFLLSSGRNSFSFIEDYEYTTQNLAL